MLKLISWSSFSGFAHLIKAQQFQNSPDVEFVRKGQALFDFSRSLFNKRFDLKPQIIALCKTEKGVQQALMYATEQGLKISIKSGGHSFEGFSLNDGGMVIDLSNMKRLRLERNNDLIAEPAVKLKQLYDYCLPRGRLLPSGSCASVGLSGITLGGGYGLFARQFGLTCDFLTGVRMVNAKGDVVDSDDFPELLWACRGGGNGNFGVVTQLRYKTVSAPSTLYQHRFRAYNLSPKKASKLAKHWFEQCDSLPNHAFSAFILNGQTLTISLTATDHDDKMKQVLRVFDLIMDKNDRLKPDPIAKGVEYYYGRRKPLYFKNISAGYYHGFADIEKCTEALFTKISSTPGAIFQINTLGGAINNEEYAGNNAYAHRGFKFLGEAQCTWKNPTHAQQSLAAMKDIQNTLYQNNIKQHYPNYPDVNIKDYKQAYYGDSYLRLQKVKQAFDPNNHFDCTQGIKTIF